MKNQLPRLMVVTQRTRMKPNFAIALEAALRGGARLIQLREKDLPENERRAFAQRAQILCENYGATFIINGAPQISESLGVGLHLPEKSPSYFENINLRGASVHSRESAQRAIEQEVDYLVFGSVFETASHPGAASAGLEALRAVCAAVEVPVFAIGGIEAHNARLCLQAGAYGIAVISAAWDANDVERAVRELVRKVEGS